MVSKFYGALGYSKGKLSNGSSLLSVQPIKAVLGLDYEDPMVSGEFLLASLI